jgi:uncharacterized FlaG/YvyC family protein
MVDVNPVAATTNIYEASKSSASRVEDNKPVSTDSGSRFNDPQLEASQQEVEAAAIDVEQVVNQVAKDINLSFRVEEDLSRMVVSVRAVGSDEIIRQFPPEEFITVAKFIASQTPDMVDEDFLKGVLFDQYS